MLGTVGKDFLYFFRFLDIAAQSGTYRLPCDMQ
jgi:hypothetical protein